MIMAKCELCPGVKCEDKTFWFAQVGRTLYIPNVKGRIAHVARENGRPFPIQMRTEPIAQCPTLAGKDTPEETAKLLQNAVEVWIANSALRSGGGW